MFEQGKQKELAAEFVAHMTNKENIAIMAQFFPPARKSVLESDAFINANKLVPAEQMKNLAAAIKNGKVLPANEKSAADPCRHGASRRCAVEADADVDAAIKAVCAAIQPLL